jgi:microcystin-dependent protein
MDTEVAYLGYKKYVPDVKYVYLNLSENNNILSACQYNEDYSPEDLIKTDNEEIISKLQSASAYDYYIYNKETDDISSGDIISKNYAAHIEDSPFIKELIENIKKDSILAAHPIGSYYWSSEDTNPAVLFGGTWEQIKDKFIYAQGSYSVGDTGGEETHTLTTSEMPSHTHTQNSHNHTQNSHNHTQNSHNHTQNAHGHNHNRGTDQRWSYNAGNGNYDDGRYPAWVGATGGSDNWVRASKYGTNFVADATATNNATTAVNNATTATNNATTAVNQSTGGGSAHNNMPPYIVAYCWRRTA